jgi:hypothetical protein
MASPVPYLQAPYYYGSRTNFPYPPPSLDVIPIGYGGSFGTGAYSLGGGYYGGQSYLTRPMTAADLYLQSNGWTPRGARGGWRSQLRGFQGYPYYEGDAVLGQMRPEWFLAQRQAYESLQPIKIPLADNRPAVW